MRKLVALYKCYRGGEWLGASLEAIRQHVDGVVAVASTQPYRPCENARQENCSDPLMDFAARTGMPVSVHWLNVSDQSDHYKHALEMVREGYGDDCGILILDTDEIWSDASVEYVSCVVRAGGKPYYVAQLYDYIKSPLYRSANISRFVVGLGSPLPPAPVITRFGGWQTHPVCGIPSPHRLHHFTLVREDASEIPEKMLNCAHADGAYHANWMQTVWANLPNGTNLHPSPNYERTWPSIEVVRPRDLPESVLRTDRTRELVARYTN